MSARGALTGLLVPALLAACVGAPSVPATLAPIDAGPTPRMTYYQINTAAWVSGFVVTVIAAQATLDSKGGPVVVTMNVENTADLASLDLPITLTAGDAVFELAHGQTMPVQAANTVTKVRLEFEVSGRATIDDGVIRIGRPGEHVAAIPLRASTAQAITLEPQTSNLRASGKAGLIRIVLRSATLRWDIPDWHEELEADRAALTIVYDATYVGDFAGGTSLTASNIGLRLPNGTTIAPRSDGHSQSVALLHTNRTAANLSSRFEIPDGLTGEFLFVIRDSGRTRGIAFTIGP